MIRVLQKRDIDRVAEIWLECNRKAHAFIPADYWKKLSISQNLKCIENG